MLKCFKPKEEQKLSYELLSCVPACKQIELTESVEYCLLSSDGLLDIYKPQEVNF